MFIQQNPVLPGTAKVPGSRPHTRTVGSVNINHYYVDAKALKWYGA